LNARPDWVVALRFLFLGGCAAGVNWGSRFVWNLIMPFPEAVAAAYLTGMALAFVLFRYFVFPGAVTSIHLQIRNFVIVNIIGFVLTWSLSIALVDWLFPRISFTFHAQAVGHALAIGAPVVTSWFGHRHFTFRNAPAGTVRPN
jgi:putative flippase GtrA